MGVADVDAERPLRRVSASIGSTPKRSFEKHHRVPATALEFAQAALYLFGIDDGCVYRGSEPLEEPSEFLGSLVVHQSSNER